MEYFLFMNINYFNFNRKYKILFFYEKNKYS